MSKNDEKKAFGCGCEDCRNTQKHLDHPFYKEAHEYRETERQGQIIKGSEKYVEPFNPRSWTPKQLLQHAMQENVDQGHYIYGLYVLLDDMEKEIAALQNEKIRLQKEADFAKNEAEHWRQRLIKAVGNQKGVVIDERV